MKRITNNLFRLTFFFVFVLGSCTTKEKNPFEGKKFSFPVEWKKYDVQGNSLKNEANLDSSKVLLIYLDPSCSCVYDEMPAWELIAKTYSTEYKIIFFIDEINISRFKELAKQVHFNYAVYHDKKWEIWKKNKIPLYTKFKAIYIEGGIIKKVINPLTFDANGKIELKL